jgi:hypothetical protein
MHMGKLTIRDHAIWSKHIEEDPDMVRMIESLPENRPINLVIDGKPVRFVKMRDGKDGRPTPGLRPDPSFRPFWHAMQENRGRKVSVQMKPTTALEDSYLSSLSGLLAEWDSPEDAEAYDAL